MKSGAVAHLTEARHVERTGPKAGQFVEWSASKGTAKGRVISVHTAKVPGVVAKMTGTSDKPAARVQLYAKNGSGWEPTSTFIGLEVETLASIATLAAPTEEEIAATESTAVDGSFDDIRTKVRAAIQEHLAAATGVDDASVWVCDLGPTWAVYDLNYNDDLWLVEYTFDAATGDVTIGAGAAVTKKVTYEPAVEGEVDSIEGRLLGAAGVDSIDGGRIFDVEIIRYGDSKNGRRYPQTVMTEAAPLYEGAKAYDHHRTTTELNTSTIQGLVGHYRNVEATGTGLKAQLHLLPSAAQTAEALDASLSNQAIGLPPLVGISHDVLTRSKQVQSAGRTLTECVQILKVNSADVVADPAAGGVATRMVAGGSGDPNTPHKENTTMNLKQLLALLRTTEAAGRAALLTEHASLLESAGITAAEALRIVEAAPATAPPPATDTRTTEAATFSKTSLTATPVIDAAITAAKLDSIRFRESIVAELADSFTEAELVTTVSRYARAVEASGLSPSVPHIEVTQDQRDKHIEQLDLMLDTHRAGGFRSLKEAYLTITDERPASLFDGSFNAKVLRECVSVRRDGFVMPYDSAERTTESLTSTSFGQIWGDSITRRMIAEYSQPSLATWRKIVSNFFNLADFRTQRIVAMGGYGVLPVVAEGASYQPLASPPDEEATYDADKRGGTEDLTIEAIRNDDLRAIQRIPQKLGLAAAQTLYRFVWDFIITNPTLTRDSVALFDAAHANVTTTNLSSTALEASRLKMRIQAAYGDTSDILSITPKLLLVPPALEALAFQLCTSAVAIPAGAPVGAASNTPNLHQGMEPVVIDYWAASSSIAWFLVGDPATVPTIEVGFLDGKEDPDLFVQNDETTGSVFTADKVTYKVRHIYGGALLDYRGFQRGQAL